MYKLSDIFEKITNSHHGINPLPEDIDSYMHGFIPDSNIMKYDTFQKVYKISPEEMEWIYREAYELYINSKYSESIFTFKWLLFFNPFIFKYWLGIAASQHMYERYEHALHAYAIASMLRTYDPYPHYYAYDCYKKLNNEEDANKAFSLAFSKAATNSIFFELKDELLKIKNK